MNANYPLRFEPLYRFYMWGGRRLGEILGKPLPAGAHVAESWEIVDHGEDQSRVAAGPLAGQSLQALVRELGADLLGRHDPQMQFPLLFKFLDAQQTLSVQVHPNDAQAACLDPPDRGKSEAWVVLHAEPASRIYAGLLAGVDRAALQLSLAHGQAERCLHFFEPICGDCVFIPAGTVHAVGAGLVVAEIQQSSDVTFRLYDWNRIGADGKPRPLHVERALDVIDFGSGPIQPVTVQSTPLPHVMRLVTCDKFVIDRWTFSTPKYIGGDRRCHIVAPLSGQVRVAGDAQPAALRRGETVLVPAAAGRIELDPEDSATLLDIYLPD
ncbi:MAG: type I phosphomannose isomerase catalytic subunit [Pirellulaceae bacterium]